MVLGKENRENLFEVLEEVQTELEKLKRKINNDLFSAKDREFYSFKAHYYSKQIEQIKKDLINNEINDY